MKTVEQLAQECAENLSDECLIRAGTVAYSIATNIVAKTITLAIAQEREARQICEWKETPIGHVETSCGITYSSGSIPVCPGCSRRIVVKEATK